MAIDALLARLERDAQAQVAAIRASGENEVRAYLTQADVDAAQQRVALLAKQAEPRRATFELELAVVRRCLRGELLRAQHALLDRVFGRAHELAQTMAGDAAFQRALPSHVQEVLGYLGGRPAQLRCPPSLATRMQTLVVEQPEIEVVSDPQAPLGLVARARDGSVSIDNTLGARLQQVRPALEPALLREVLR